MNRPEPIELENNLGPDAVTGEINRVPWMAYDVDEMDIYIAEKDAEIAELKQKLDDAQAKVYADSIDAWKRERRLKRALWLARAERAKTEHKSKWNFSTIYKDYIAKWKNIERKCLAKAEEYK